MTLLYTLQIFLVLILIALVLVQRTSTSGLSGLSGGSSSMGIVPKRSKGDFLSKLTIIIGICFFINSIFISKLFLTNNKVELDFSKETLQKTQSVPKQ